jgi:SAM-dependent methyltransferase
MPTTNCRVCGHHLFEEPLLRFENMPRAAQFLPDAKSLEKDKGIDLEVCQCSGCGLVQLSNDPVPYYRDVVRAAAFSDEMRDFRLMQFEGFTRTYSLEEKKIVEIGCGRGEYLSLMQQCGADAYGLEHSEESAAWCARNGLRVSAGFVDSSNSRINHAPFDAFYILNFLEHLPDPNSTLRGVYNNLTDGAIGLVEVPNFEMMLRNRLSSEFTIDHLLYFTKETLATTLGLNGFEIIACNEVWHEYITSAVVRKRNRLDLSLFREYQARLRDEIGKYIGRFGDKKVAIWGAGHQALAVISLLGLADKIRYVVDSAAFKQNKYTPATHLRIVSPDALDSNPVDAVIVMAASYSDEVAGIIRRKFAGNMHISILRDFGLEIV